jgi:hypothetical protein
VSLVSCNVNMVGVYWSSKDWRHGTEVLRDEMFHVVKWVGWLI